MRDDFLTFGRPLIGEEEIAAVVATLRSGWLGTGPRVARFERELEAYLEIPHVRCVSSCTDALMLGLEVLGVGSGDEVLVPAMTFAASANAIERVGARPVFVDSEPDTGLLDLDHAASLVTPRTRAIMPVHLAGRPVDMDRLAALRDRFGLLVVEDAAHAIGARWRGVPIGGHGDLAAFSFYVTKNITTVEGGALATDSPGIASEVERLALHGLTAGAWERYSDAGFRHYEVVTPGVKSNMTDVQAAIGSEQLRRLDGWLECREALWARYDALLADLPVLRPAPVDPRARHTRHLYQIRVTPGSGRTRNEVLAGLHERRIGAGVHYRAVHLQPYYRDRYNLLPQDLPVANVISEQTVSLPLEPSLSEGDQDDVVAAIREVLGR
jgi:dTDP-4-amino-4,6-dideoxygalactose transaminase